MVFGARLSSSNINERLRAAGLIIIISFSLSPPSAEHIFIISGFTKTSLSLPPIPGYSTGIIIKEQKDRKEYINDFYAAHPQAPRPMTRQVSAHSAQQPLNHLSRRHAGRRASLDSGAHASAKRAQSLPDVLDDGEDTIEHAPRGRSMSVRQMRADYMPSGRQFAPAHSPLGGQRNGRHHSFGASVGGRHNVGMRPGPNAARSADDLLM